MLQSDYLKNKKLATILQEQTKLNNVLSANLYTDLKTKGTMDAAKMYIDFESKGIILDNSGARYDCFQYILDSATDERPNRLKTMTDPIGRRGFPRQHAYDEYMILQKINNQIMPCKMFQKCDEFLHSRKYMIQIEVNDQINMPFQP